MRKNKLDQSCGGGKLVKASGNAINIRPGPKNIHKFIVV